MSLTQINSDFLLDNIEHHFRVSAGPGAGKTHWLVEHIRNVLHNSERLAKTRKIACITYTNIAVETITGRLGTSADRVEVSTIHSFLYKHILKPYGALLVSDFGLNVTEMDGHDDRILSNYSFLSEWKIRTGQQRIREDKNVVAAFQSIKWNFDVSGNLIVKTDYPHKANGYPIKNESYFEYKKMAWEKGIVHHDDVLFLSFQILKKFPYVLEVIRAKFPYFFVDEFQDSNPIQIEILKLIGQNETIIGIIGDKAQSIYGFQGALPSQFQIFSLGHIIDYVISDNRRSSNEIVKLLNDLRDDIVQCPIRNESTMQPIILVGEMNLALRYAKADCLNETVTSLSRDNITSNAMKIEIGGVVLNGKLFKDLMEIDSNRNRSILIAACIKAVEFARENKFKDSIKEFEKVFRYKNDKQRGKLKALKVITILLEKYDKFKNGSLYDFSVFVKSEVNDDISKVTGGAIRTFYDSHSYQDLALCVKIPEDMSLHKTIHKSKGDEFDNVLLVLKKETDLSFILAPNLNDDTNAAEEQRVNYVAVSRARNILFISVPTLSTANQEFLETNFTIVNV